MSAKVKDWEAIAQSTKFIELRDKKSAFLIKLWIFGVFSFFLLPLGSAYAPTLFNIKILGRLNLSYFYCLYLFVMGLSIAMYYAHRCNRDFDPLTKQVLDDIHSGVMK